MAQIDGDADKVQMEANTLALQKKIAGVISDYNIICCG